MEYDFNSFIVKDWYLSKSSERWFRFITNKEHSIFIGSININCDVSEKYSPRYSFDRNLLLLPLQNFETNSIEECKQLIDLQLTKLHKLIIFL